MLPVGIPSRIHNKIEKYKKKVLYVHLCTSGVKKWLMVVFSIFILYLNHYKVTKQPKREQA